MSKLDVKRWGLPSWRRLRRRSCSARRPPAPRSRWSGRSNPAGFGGIGAGDMTTVEKISGLRKRAVSTTKMTGFLGKMAGDIGGDEITDIPKDVVWRLDHKRKTYSESKITPPPQSKEDPGGKQGREGEGREAERPHRAQRDHGQGDRRRRRPSASTPARAT